MKRNKAEPRSIRESSATYNAAKQIRSSAWSTLAFLVLIRHLPRGVAADVLPRAGPVLAEDLRDQRGLPKGIGIPETTSSCRAMPSRGGRSSSPASMANGRLRSWPGTRRPAASAAPREPQVRGDSNHLEQADDRSRERGDVQEVLMSFGREDRGRRFGLGSGSSTLRANALCPKVAIVLVVGEPIRRKLKR